MAYQITVVTNAIVITDSVTSEDLFDLPKKDIYYDVDKLNNDEVIQIRFIDTGNSVDQQIPAIPLADSLTGGAIPFTATTWKAFARANMGA